MDLFTGRNEMKGVILHGGSGTRLRPLTYTDVKQLLPLAGKPVSEYALLNLIEIGIREINIIVGEIGKKEVQDYYGDGEKWGVNISYTHQEAPLGIAHAISLVEDFVDDENFVVLLGDNYFQNGISSMNRSFAELGTDAYVALTKVANPSRFGIAEVSNGKIIKIEEKPRNPRSDLAITGAYFLRKSIFDVIKELKPSWRGELEITEAFQIMLDRGMKIGYSVIEGWWKDTGTVDEFLDCNRMVLDTLKREVSGNFADSSVSGRVKIESGVKIMGKTRVLGPCYIGKNTILQDTYVGPYSSIGPNCKLKNVEIEDSVIMDGSSIELTGTERIRESLIGSNVIIKPNDFMGLGMRLIIGRDSRLEI